MTVDEYLDWLYLKHKDRRAMMGLPAEQEKKGGLRGLFAALGGHKVVKKISKQEYEARQRGNNRRTDWTTSA